MVPGAVPVSTWVRRLLQEDDGATLVEFALVTPVLILILVASLDFARALNAYVTITNASREAAHFAVLHPAADDAALTSFVATRIVPLDPAALESVTAPYTPSTDVRWSVAALSPGTVTVTVRYRWDAATWMVGQFFSAVSGSRTFEVSSAMEAMR
jgi:Flp pilus assembly protein TadG